MKRSSVYLSLVVLVPMAVAGELFQLSNQSKSDSTSGDQENGNSPTKGPKWLWDDEGTRGLDKVNPSAKIKVVKVSDKSYRLEYSQPNLKVKKGESYLISLWVKTDEEAVISFNCMKSYRDPVLTLVTQKWKPFGMGFEARRDGETPFVEVANVKTVPGQTFWVGGSVSKYKKYKH
jgi:hypothetical protein